MKKKNLVCEFIFAYMEEKGGSRVWFREWNDNCLVLVCAALVELNQLRKESSLAGLAC